MSTPATIVSSSASASAAAPVSGPLTSAKTITKELVNDWTDQQLAEWVAKIGAEYVQYADKIVEAGLDGSSVFEPKKLAEIVTDKTHCKTILDKLSQPIKISVKSQSNTIAPMVTPPKGMSDIPVDYAELEAAINTKPLSSIILPTLDSKPFNPDFPLDSSVQRFVTPEESPLSAVLCAIEGMARTMANDSKSPCSDAAKHLLNYFSCISQLHSWLHVQIYIHSPQLYIDRVKTYRPEGDAIAASLSGEGSKNPVIGPIDELHNNGLKLLRRLCQRIDWLMQLQRKAGKHFDAEFYMKVITADRVWAEDVSSYLKEAENKVTEMLTQNPQQYKAFLQLQRGLCWPHSDGLRREIERANFVFRPMRVKRDRCVCETCGVEVSGWRSWHNPWSFHDYTKHPPSFRPRGGIFVLPPALVDVKLNDPAKK